MDLVKLWTDIGEQHKEGFKFFLHERFGRK